MNHKPNVIWVFGDQQPQHMLSCNGNPDIYTPNIDILAREGINFINATSGYPLCSPFRGSLLTGKYPHHAVNGNERQLNPKMTTIAHILNEEGYFTSYFGKWHLDGFEEKNGNVALHIVPPERRGGFQNWIGYENNNMQWESWIHGGEGENEFQYRLPGYESDEMTNLLIREINRIKKRQEESKKYQPFFAIMSVQPPHDPYFAPEDFMLKYHDEQNFSPKQILLRPNVPRYDNFQDIVRRRLAGAYAMVENLDWNLGRIIQCLEECDFKKNTFIFFFSDHGDMHGSHGQFRKTTIYEESIRIPFIIGCPLENKNVIKRNVKDKILLNHVDIGPTTLGICGIPIPNWMEGNDLSYRIIQLKKSRKKKRTKYENFPEFQTNLDKEDQKITAITNLIEEIDKEKDHALEKREIEKEIEDVFKNTFEIGKGMEIENNETFEEIERNEQQDIEPKSLYLQYIIPTGHHDSIDKPWRGIITKDGWKYAAFEKAEWVLFDLNNDPYEQQNLVHYQRYHEKKRMLNQMLQEWIKNTDDDFILPNMDERK